MKEIIECFNITKIENSELEKILSFVANRNWKVTKVNTNDIKLTFKEFDGKIVAKSLYLRDWMLNEINELLERFYNTGNEVNPITHKTNDNGYVTEYIYEDSTKDYK